MSMWHVQENASGLVLSMVLPSRIPVSIVVRTRIKWTNLGKLARKELITVHPTMLTPDARRNTINLMPCFSNWLRMELQPILGTCLLLPVPAFIYIATKIAFGGSLFLRELSWSKRHWMMLMERARCPWSAQPYVGSVIIPNWALNIMVSSSS